MPTVAAGTLPNPSSSSLVEVDACRHGPRRELVPRIPQSLLPLVISVEQDIADGDGVAAENQGAVQFEQEVGVTLTL